MSVNVTNHVKDSKLLTSRSKDCGGSPRGPHHSNRLMQDFLCKSFLVDFLDLSNLCQEYFFFKFDIVLINNCKYMYCLKGLFMPWSRIRFTFDSIYQNITRVQTWRCLKNHWNPNIKKEDYWRLASLATCIFKVFKGLYIRTSISNSKLPQFTWFKVKLYNSSYKIIPQEPGQVVVPLKIPFK